MQELHISVRNLVEFIFRAGDIDNRAGKLASAEAMMEGSRIHRKIQKSMDTSYQAEVPLKMEWKANDYVLVVEGRADGIAYGKFQPDLPAVTESVLQPEMEFAAEIPPEEEISFIDEIKGGGKVVNFLADYFLFEGAPNPLKFIGAVSSKSYLGFLEKVEKNFEDTKLLKNEKFKFVLKDIQTAIPWRNIRWGPTI